MKKKRVFKDVKQKIIVAQGRHPMFGNPIDFKVLHSEFVENAKVAKERVQELKNEYKDTEALSVHYFSA